MSGPNECSNNPLPVFFVCSGMCQLVNGSVGETECVPVCGEFCACDGVEECLVCCLEGGRCALANSTILLSDGSQCSNGICVDVCLCVMCLCWYVCVMCSCWYVCV